MNKSGKSGKIMIGVSDVADVKNWRFRPRSNNPQFAHSGTAGYKTSVAGVKSGEVSFEVVVDFTDPIWDVLEEGTEATLLLHMDGDGTVWTVPCRIDEIEYNIDINDGGEISASVTASTMGAWTKPPAA